MNAYTREWKKNKREQNSEITAQQNMATAI